MMWEDAHQHPTSKGLGGSGVSTFWDHLHPPKKSRGKGKIHSQPGTLLEL